MYEKNKRALVDLVAILAVALALLVVANILDLFESFVEFSRQHESWNLDELVAVPVIFSLGFVVYL